VEREAPAEPELAGRLVARTHEPLSSPGVEGALTVMAASPFTSPGELALCVIPRNHSMWHQSCMA
jgi:hypothetical protein